MNNPIVNWWRSQQFKLAVSHDDRQKAVQILHDIQKSGARFSWLEKLFRDKLQLERASLEHKREIANLSKQLTELAHSSTDKSTLSPNQEFINYVSKKFKLIQHDEYKVQSTGIHESLFEDFEHNLVTYLQDELRKIPQKQLALKIEDALEDINNLKIGQEPDYRFSLTPHVYFMKYFLENTYCVYLAWFFIYQNGLLTSKINILDIAAGPGTVAYGLALFLQSINEFVNLPQTHMSYYSLEKQDSFQFRGLQFWRKYIESRISPINTYFRFVTADLLGLEEQSYNLPKDFFDFIVISHCFFIDADKRVKANSNYQQIFATSLKNDGYVLLIIQDKKLFKSYNIHQSENINQEQTLVRQFATDIGLKLVWYKYLTSTNSRVPLSGNEFGKFAKENLPKQLQMDPVLQQYLGQRGSLHYTLDDYVILGKKS